MDAELFEGGVTAEGEGGCEMILAKDQIRAERAREIKYKEVNRLILIGNGFDLAHGLKTSFKHFIEDYFHEILAAIKNNLFYEDPLISITSKVYFPELVEKFDSLSRSQAYKKLLDILSQPQVTLGYEKEFLKRIKYDLEFKSWVDIEIVYFNLLKEANNSYGSLEVIEINKQLNFIKHKLRNYLFKEIRNSQISQIPKLRHQFKQNILKQECIPGSIQAEKDVSSICFLNFNYTSIPELYSSEFTGVNIKHIPIHGTLEGDDIFSQGIVFGFGDELDEEYLKFENKNNDDLFEHIKSFKYLHFQNYRNLLDFIESKPFQVQVYGHSLGLSDRTLLNTIFENENCISIKLFYHKWEGGDDFEKKTYAISRHFKSKASLRSKVVNKEFCEPMGQAFYQ